MRALGTAIVGALLAVGRLAAQDAPPAKLPDLLTLPDPKKLDPAPQTPPVAPNAPVPAPPRPDASSKPDAANPPANQSQSSTPQANTSGTGTDQTKPEFRDCHLGPCHRVWVGGGPLLWWIKDASTPTLAQSADGTIGGTPDYGRFNGVQADAGLWFNDRHTTGAFIEGFSLEQKSVSAALAGFGPITRPLFNVVTGSPVDVIVASPGVAVGRIDFDTSSRLWGVAAGFVKNVAYCPATHTVDVFFGVRHLDLDETLQVRQETTALAGTLALAGAQVNALRITDRFDARNVFTGGELGVRAECRHGPLFLAGCARVAVGPNHEAIDVFGRTDEIGGTRSALGGLLAVPGGNAGGQVTNRFAVVPAVNGTVGCQLTAHLRASVGYDFLYINDVARPGGQIDPTFNPRLVPASLFFGSQSGPAAPRPTVRRDDFYAHGLQVLLEMRY
jgi:hypothetical protein